jgi:hypothetical protein
LAGATPEARLWVWIEACCCCGVGLRGGGLGMRSSGLGATGTGPTWKVVAGIRPQVTGLRAKGWGGVFWSSDMVFSIAGDLARFVTDQFLSR